MSDIGNRAVYAVYRGASGLLQILPLPWVYRVGSWIGTAARFLAPGYRALARRNAQIAFGKEQGKAIADASFPRMGANFLSAIRLAAKSKPEVGTLLVHGDGSPMREALTQGKGLIVLVAHLGNWEMLAHLGTMVPGTPVCVVYQKVRNPFIDKDIRKMRESGGMRLVERKEGLTVLLKTLREGGLVAVLADQHAGNGGIWSPFFGKLASSSPLAAMLALRTGAPLIPAAALTSGPAQWRFYMGETTNLSGHDVSEATTRVNRIVEKMIQEEPADWFWVHNRWKTPHPRFLLQRYRRGLALPDGSTKETLHPFRMAVRVPNWLGDCVMTLPAVAAMREGRPDLHLTIVCREKIGDFWKRVPGVDAVVTLPNKASLFESAKRIRQAGPFEAIVLFPNSPRVALEAWLAGIPRRTGVPGRWRKWLLNQIFEEKKRGPQPRHQAWDYLAMAEHIGVEKPAELNVSGLLSGQKISSTRPDKFRIAVCAGAEYGPAKRWLPERFAEVIQTVSARRECEWVFFGVPKDAEFVESIISASETPVSNRVGKTTLGELIDELGQCDLLLANDSGPMHLATALGIPCVALFGSTEPALTGPIGPGHQVLRHQVECSPCFLRECPIDFRCMKAISVSEVVETLLRSMENESALTGKS